MIDHRPLTILFVTGSLHRQSGGPCWTVRETTKALVRRGHRPLVVGTKDRWRQGAAEGWTPVPAFSFPKVGPSSLHCSPGLSRWLKRSFHDVDVVALQSVWVYNHRAVARWCRRRNIAYLLTLHGNLNQEALNLSAWKKRVARRWFVDEVLGGASCFHALTEAEYRAIRRLGLKQPVCVIPNGIAPPAEEPSKRNSCPWRQRSGGRRICAYLGRFHPIKGLENLLAAWSRLGGSRTRWSLLLAGPDPHGYRKRLERRASQWGMADQVVFAGPQYGDAKSQLLYAADFFVLPSLSEGMPVAALEAMAHGRPVLVTEPCGLPEVHQYQLGRIVRPTVDGLQEGLTGLMAMTEEDRKAMGRRAGALISARFSWERVTGELEHVYRWLLGQCDPPTSVHFD